MAQGKQTPASSRSRVTERIPVLSNEHLNAFSGSTISNYAGRVYNGIINRYSNDPNRAYVEQRPSFSFGYQPADESITDVKGRGIHQWSAVTDDYWMNDDIIYKGSYGNPCSVQGGDTAIASGSKKVYFQEWSSANSDYLFIFDPENDGIYVINSAAPTTIINIADRSGSGTLEGFAVGDSWDFDTLNAALALGLCDGAVALDGYLFIGTTTARIYNSNNDNWIVWSGLDFLTAERDNDRLLYIDKSKDNVVAFGERTIELFYDNANAVGSPLKPRTDITHRLGISEAQAAWGDGDDIHFMSVKPSGAMELATLKDFSIVPHTNTSINSYFLRSKFSGGSGALAYNFVFSGFSTGGHTYVVITSFNLSGVAQLSLVYDTSVDAWYEWETTLDTNTKFPLVGWVTRESEVSTRPAGILSNGDIIAVEDDFIPVDVAISSSGGADVNINMVIVLDNYDFNTTSTKFMFSAEYAGNQPAASQTLTVAWTDDDGVTSQSQTIDLADRTQINRLGRFVKRKFTLTYAGSEQIRFEGIDVTFSQGKY